MTIRPIRSLAFVVVALAMMLAAPAVSAQTPPKGDNADNPVNVKLNTKKTVDNIQFATMQSTAIEDASCDGDDSSDHSVWFRFTMPRGGLVDLDSGGSIVNGVNGSHSFVVLSLYDDDAGTTEIDCVISSTARLLNQNLPAGSYLARIASDSVNEPTGPSQYRLSVRLRYVSGLLEDPSFENQPLGVYWKAANAGDPPKVTRACIPDCVIRFGGVANGKLKQKIAMDPSQVRFKDGDVASADAFINNTGVGGANVRLILKISYLDDTPTTKSSLTRLITQTGTTVSTGFGSIYAEINSQKVKHFKFMIISPQVTDTFSVSSTALIVQAGSSARIDVLPLPLPLPPLQ